MRRQATCALAIAAVVLTPTAAWAITYGEPDDGAHPNVAALVVVPLDADTGAQNFCSGTLVDSDTIVTAAHCSWIDNYYPGAPVRVTFEDVLDANKDGYVDPGIQLLDGTLIPHPGSEAAVALANPYDVAVFQLEGPISSIDPAKLPTEGLLDGKSLRGSSFTAVGYGDVRETNRTAGQAWIEGYQRMQATQTLTSVTSAWANFSGNLAKGEGGTCVGDSGGPHFLENTVVSVTVTGDRWCKALDKTYRLDTPWVRDFLGEYVTLP